MSEFKKKLQVLELVSTQKVEESRRTNLPYEIERNVINALSDNNTTCKAKD